METAGYLGLFLLAMSLCSTGHALIENLYCGKDNCYEGNLQVTFGGQSVSECQSGDVIFSGQSLSECQSGDVI